jgi:hypothetical protein
LGTCESSAMRPSAARRQRPVLRLDLRARTHRCGHDPGPASAVRAHGTTDAGCAGGDRSHQRRRDPCTRKRRPRTGARRHWHPGRSRYQRPACTCDGSASRPNSSARLETRRANSMSSGPREPSSLEKRPDRHAFGAEIHIRRVARRVSDLGDGCDKTRPLSEGAELEVGVRTPIQDSPVLYTSGVVKPMPAKRSTK